MHKRTKALKISSQVKEAVWERDHGHCVLCGSPYGQPNAHFVARSQGGLGVEQNIVTLCQTCHNEYDNGPFRKVIRTKLRAYLISCYADWDERKLYYRKGQI